MNAAADIFLATPRGRLAGLHWSVPGGPPVLCLHGWLDNAASFIPLSSFLAALDLLALDLPGHGQSDHHHPNAHYYFTDYLLDIDVALDSLGWSSCHLVGHSMGGAIASLYAVAAPERVRSLVLLDGLGPISAEAETGAERLRRSLESVRAGPRRKKAYASIADMVSARQAADADLGDEPARLICERSASKHDEAHYQWSYDPALHWVSPSLMTEEQVLGLLRHIRTPALSVTATPFSRYGSEEKFRKRSAAIPHGRHELLTGKHHFHMDQPEAVATAVQSFILEHEQPSREKP